MDKTNKILNNIRENLPDKNQKKYFEIHITRYQWILKFITGLNLSASANILDIGCYPPHLFNALTAFGYKLFGISSEHEKISQKNVKTANIETDKLPFQDNSFDLVLCSEVIEHLSKSPLLVFQEINRILRPGGYFLITTPNIIRTQNLIRMLIGHNISFPVEQLNSHLYYRHNREYTLIEIEDLIKLSGLKISQSGYFISYSPFRQKNKYDSYKLKIIKRLNFLFMTIFPRRRDTLFVLAQKP